MDSLLFRLADPLRQVVDLVWQHLGWLKHFLIRRSDRALRPAWRRKARAPPSRAPRRRMSGLSGDRVRWRSFGAYDQAGADRPVSAIRKQRWPAVPRRGNLLPNIATIACNLKIVFGDCVRGALSVRRRCRATTSYPEGLIRRQEPPQFRAITRPALLETEQVGLPTAGLARWPRLRIWSYR